MKTKSWISFFLALTVWLSLLGQPQVVQAAQPAAPQDCAPSEHYGMIMTDETWCAGNNPHILTSSVMIYYGVTVTIEPGVTVMGSGQAELKVLGHLSAVGTADQPILFTSTINTGPIQWAGLSFDGGTGDLQYVTVRYGGDDGNSIGRGNIALNNVTSGQVNIQHSTISDVSHNFYLNLVECLWVVNSHVTVNDTTFSGCASAPGQYDRNYPILIRGAASAAILTDNTFVNNYKNRIAIEPGAMMGQNATLWPQAVNGAYELLGTDQNMVGANFIVPAGVTLTVQPGVTVLANLERELEVQGSLEAPGTADQPVIFTSVSDTYPEQWAGVVINGGSGHLNHTLIRYAGAPNSAGWRAGLTLNNVLSGEVVLQDSTISDNRADFYLTVSHGMVINNSHAQVTGSLFSNNGKPAGGAYDRDYALYIAGADSVVTLTNNTFTGNRRDKIGLAPGTFSNIASTTLAPQAVSDGYELDGSYTIPADNTLVLEPGVTLSGRGAQDELLVLGHLQAVGTPEQPITFTSGSDSAWNQWAGVVFSGGSGHLSHVIARYAGQKSSLDTYGTLNAVNVPAGGLIIENSQISDGFNYGLHVSNSPVTVSNTHFSGNGENPRDNQTAIMAVGSGTQLTLTGNLFDGNARDLMLYDGSASLTNNALIGGWSDWYSGYNHGIVINTGASATLRHNTIANLQGSGLLVASGGSANLTNSIFAQNSTAVTVDAGGTVSLEATLWDRNGTNISGTASSETGSLSGIAGFAPDGYHLTRYSAALEQGVDAGVSQDLDGEARPSPAGTAPDLGADEFLYTLGQDFAAEMFPFAPQWVILPDAVSGNPSGKLRQGYFMRYFYGSPEATPPALPVHVSNTLPAELAFETQQASPLMDFLAQGQALTWDSQQPLEKDRSGEIILRGLYDQPIPGTALTNTAVLSAGTQNFNLQASSQVPLFAPLITFPGNGEICSSPDNTVSLTVKGAAQNSAVVKIYEDSTYVGETTAGSDGLFSFTYTSTRAGIDTFTLSARACLPSDPATCSDPFPVNLTPQLSFWDPQLSYWEFFDNNGSSSIARFRLNGLFTTQDSVRFKATIGFPHSTLHLHLCEQVYEVWATVNDVNYYPENTNRHQPAPSVGWFGDTTIQIADALSKPCSLLSIRLQENGIIESDQSCSLTDPDGYVYDINAGFNADSPTDTTLAGAKVTCMHYVEAWGGWVPWPAQLYDNQVNPQVTGADGHFAFFTPPGLYYLQVEDAAGYQPWRSPVIEVVDEVVHMNVPLTPVSAEAPIQVTLTADGPLPAGVIAPRGSTVAWVSELSGVLSPNEIMLLVQDPIQRALSSLQPESGRQAWDSGLLIPGQAYTRTFTFPGTYTYTDGGGHTGSIIVPYQVFLPTVRH